MDHLACWQAVETDNGTLTFTDNASNSPQTVSLIGTGTSGETLYEFPRQAAGADPMSNVAFDAQGNVYGTTFDGGTSKNCSRYDHVTGCGTVFKVTPSGRGSVLHSFTGSDSAHPEGGSLALDHKGNLYGTASGSFVDCGTAFELSPKGDETVLHKFCDSPNDGIYPTGGLVFDSQGTLYGTTLSGGSSSNCSNGCGTVFKLTPGGTETIIYSFGSYPDDAIGPIGPLVLDSQGNIYGASGGGGSSTNCYGTGCGTVFKITPSGVETVLYSFNGFPTDGMSPNGGLVFDTQGNLYGTTGYGGPSTNCPGEGYPPLGCGTVFSLTLDGTETVLHTFSGADGQYPTSVVFDKIGNLYGAAFPILFELMPDGSITVIGTVFMEWSGLRRARQSLWHCCKSW